MNMEEGGTSITLLVGKRGQWCFRSNLS